MSDESPTPPEPPPTRPPGNPLALGCGGFVSFFALAFAVGMGAATVGWLVLVPLVALAALAAWQVRAATPAGRAAAARFAVGFAVAAVIFGGCIVAISRADFR